MNEPESRQVELFGGAISCALPSSGFEDVSMLRQVPDNQEVFVQVETGATIIIELVERQAHVAHDACGAFFFSDLAAANGAVVEGAEYIVTVPQQELVAATDYPHLAEGLTTSGVVTVPRCATAAGGSLYAAVTAGTQRVAKFSSETGCENEVFVAMVIARLPPPISSDVLISVTAPQWIHERSSDAAVVTRLLAPAEVIRTARAVLRTLTVHNWGLFVQEP